QCYLLLSHLPSFPTRRSSDLSFIVLTVLAVTRPPAHVAKTIFLFVWRKSITSCRSPSRFISSISFTLSMIDNTLRYLAYRTNPQDRKSTRLNSSHVKISYAVF